MILVISFEILYPCTHFISNFMGNVVSSDVFVVFSKWCKYLFFNTRSFVFGYLHGTVNCIDTVDIPSTI